MAVIDADVGYHRPHLVRRFAAWVRGRRRTVKRMARP